MDSGTTLSWLTTGRVQFDCKKTFGAAAHLKQAFSTTIYFQIFPKRESETIFRGCR